jgi:hypothetical protein
LCAPVGAEDDTVVSFMQMLTDSFVAFKPGPREIRS